MTQRTPRSIVRRLFVAVISVAVLVAATTLVAPGVDAQKGPRTDGKADPIGVCIESDIVQDSRRARRLGAGDEFRIGLVTYVIIENSPSCSFNCYGGWDMNCDGKLGDFCSVELDRRTVAGVKACLESLQPDEPAETESSNVS